MKGNADKVDRASSLRSKPYPAYKDSGVEWLGKIPAHWSTGLLKRHLTSLKDGTHGTFERVLDGVPLLSAKNVSESRTLLITDNESLISKEDYDEINRNGYLKTGDLLLTIVGTIGRAAIFDLEEPVAFQRSVAVLRPDNAISVRFLLHLTQSSYFQSVLTAQTKQSAQGGVYLQVLGTIQILVPPLSDQCAIAALLDRETAKIGALVAKKERLIELLQEKRAALITHAVTKGLDPTVPMKESGIEWLGKNPARWQVKRVKWIAKMESGHTPDRKVEAYWTNCDVPWVSLNDTGYLKDHDYISDTVYHVNALGLENSSARLLPERAVVFSRDATVGLCAITTRPMAVSQHFIAWLCSADMLPEYLLYVFRSMTQELERLTMGATIMTIGMPDVRTLVTPVPPYSEQERIVEYICQETAKLDALIAKVWEGIERLKEYRTALISAAVTGKIDVRDTLAESGQGKATSLQPSAAT